MYIEAVNLVARFLGICGVSIVLYGGLKSILFILEKEILNHNFSYNSIRRSFTLKIMVGLEFFVASDLIKTVLEPSLSQIAIVAVIVAIRTVVGHSLNQELKELGPEENIEGDKVD